MRTIIYKLLLVSSIVILSNYIYTYFFFEKDIQTHSDIINLIRDIPNKTEVIYLGESSNLSYRENDKDKRNISSFIGDFFPKLKIKDVTKRAAHAGIYKALLDQIPENNQIQSIIVTLNLRSFNAQWIYSNLETSLLKSLVLLKPYPPLVNRFLLSFKAYDIKTDQEREAQFKSMWKENTLKFSFPFKYENVIDWDFGMFNTGLKDKNGNIDFAATELACHYIKAYAFQIDTLKNPRIKDFDNIVKLAKQNNWNIIFNLIAENTEKASRLVGPELILLMNQNAELLIQRYTEKGVQVVNNLNTVEDKEFIDQNWTSEHYAEKGRKQIAFNVAHTLKTFHPSSFKAMDDYIISKPSVLHKKSSDINALIQKKNDEHTDQEIESIIARIKADPQWNQTIIEKAKKNNISYQKQVQLDAEWLFNDEKK